MKTVGWNKGQAPFDGEPFHSPERGSTLEAQRTKRHDSFTKNQLK